MDALSGRVVRGRVRPATPMKQIDDGIWVTAPLLQARECSGIIARAEAASFRVARDYDRYERHNQETFLDEPMTAQLLLDRLRGDGSTLAAARMDPTLECYRYLAGEYLAPHRDAATEIEPGVWSTLTLVLYLNDDFEGGETGFPEPKIAVRPRPGHAVLFEHSLLHEGSPVLAGTKYVVRTSITTV